MLNLAVTRNTKETLKRLTRCYGLTQDTLLTVLLGEEQGQLLGKLTEEEKRRYFEAVTT
jgi:hypothetical protein